MILEEIFEVRRRSRLARLQGASRIFEFVSDIVIIQVRLWKDLQVLRLFSIRGVFS